MSGNDHFHYVDDIHGAVDPWHGHSDLERLIAGLRQDLAAAEARIREADAQICQLEEAHSDDLRRLWNHISNMPGGI